MKRAGLLLAALLLSACGGASDPMAQAPQGPGPDPDPREAPPPATEAVEFEASDGARLHAQLTYHGELKARPLIVQFSPYGDIGRDLPDFGAGYNHVYVNVRGTGSSTGTWSAIGARDQQDVAEFVAWACHQPWSNGHIGLYGFSASAIAVYNSMHLKLECVDAAALMAGTADLYRDLLYPGGMFNLVPGAVVAFGAGLPLIAAGFIDFFTSGQLPIDAIFSGTGFLGTILQVMTHASEDEFWVDRTQRPGPNRFPVLADTGFYDVESRGPFESYQLLRRQGVQVHLRVFGAHDGTPEGTPGPRPEYQRWFDRYLLGQNNGIDREPRVQLLVGHGSYEAQIGGAVTRVDATDWPVPGTRWQTFWLDPARGHGAYSSNDGGLSPVAPQQQATQPYLALTSLPTATDPNTTGTVAAGGAITLFKAFPILTQLTLMEPLSLTYTTPEFSEDVDVVGPAALTVHVATALPEADLHAVITDVWPDGSAHAVGVGRLRSSYPDIVEERSVRDSRGEIVQPYNDFSSKSYALPGQLREYHVEFWPIGNRFAAGHKLRLYLVGAATYTLPAPNLNFVSIGGDTPSRLQLPVLPGSDACRAMGTTC
ncbi:CocE/NonD family hydrolase [Solimonas sp. K1W22B-7]|uniref:CocE/NonD family hydrolase n=1 Tax=Solimonas sp. K1W22B-7 TaxID=2303331 RepID=UPI000E32F7AC|nr:CocE/NonD family hydrolase [Solimonas sp. K1W22B-7]AXQ30336.1 CocE/NonD family hydrolase [Solimonas sp. K1W22B-7]